MHSVVFPSTASSVPTWTQSGRACPESRVSCAEKHHADRPRRGKEKGGEMIGGACAAKTGAAAVARKPSVSKGMWRVIAS